MKNRNLALVLIIAGAALALVVRQKNKMSVHAPAKVATAVSAPTPVPSAPATPNSSAPPQAQPARPAAPDVPPGRAYRDFVPQKRAQTPCTDDYLKTCKYNSVGPADPEQRECMQKNMAKFSPACQKFAGEQGQKRDSINKECALDVSTFCPRLQGPDLFRCLFMDPSRLSPSCRQAVTALTKMAH